MLLLSTGHGKELAFCPKCMEALQPGKHHIGCSAGRSAPRQAAKRKLSVGVSPRPAASAHRACERLAACADRCLMKSIPLLFDGQAFWSCCTAQSCRDTSHSCRATSQMRSQSGSDSGGFGRSTSSSMPRMSSGNSSGTFWQGDMGLPDRWGPHSRAPPI